MSKLHFHYSFLQSYYESSKMIIFY